MFAAIKRKLLNENRQVFRVLFRCFDKKIKTEDRRIFPDRKVSLFVMTSLLIEFISTTTDDFLVRRSFPDEIFSSNEKFSALRATSFDRRRASLLGDEFRFEPMEKIVKIIQNDKNLEMSTMKTVKSSDKENPEEQSVNLTTRSSIAK